jgi:hypothetical protein
LQSLSSEKTSFVTRNAIVITNSDKAELMLSVIGVPNAECGPLADTLRSMLLDLHPSIDSELRPSDELNQDFGSSLILLFGAPAVVAIAQGIEAFLRKYQGASIVIQRGDEKFEVKGVSDNTVAEVVRVLKEKL